MPSQTFNQFSHLLLQRVVVEVASGEASVDAETVEVSEDVAVIAGAEEGSEVVVVAMVTVMVAIEILVDL